MDFALLSPEINSGRMYAGPGPGSMLAAAAAWDGLAAELHSTAADHASVISGLTGGAWQGPSSASMAAAATPQVAWLATTAAQAEQAGAQAKAATAAYETAFAMTVPPPVIAANRALLTSLVATNFLGQNTPAIAATEAQYGEMWAQDAAAMYGYAGTSQAASQMTPFTPAQQTTNPGGLGGQGVAVAQAVGTSAGHAQTILSAGQLMSAVPQALQALASPAAASTGTGLSSILSSPIVTLFEQLFSMGASGGIIGSVLGTGITIGTNTIPALAATGPAALHAIGGLAGLPLEAITYQASALSPLGGVSAGIGQGALVGGLSVPQSWATAAPAMRLAAAASPSTGFVAAGGPGGLFSGMPLFGGAPLMALTGRGMADSQDRRKPEDGVKRNHQRRHLSGDAFYD
jgi:PPE-repeat protein